jgi:hypothetical protein
MGDFMTNYGIIICYILLVAAVGAAVFGWVRQLLKDPGAIKGVLIGVGVLVVVGVISFMLSSDSIPANMVGVSPEEAKQVGTGLYAFYILALAAVAATLYSEVSKIFK